MDNFEFMSVPNWAIFRCSFYETAGAREILDWGEEKKRGNVRKMRRSKVLINPIALYNIGTGIYIKQSTMVGGGGEIKKIKI